MKLKPQNLESLGTLRAAFFLEAQKGYVNAQSK
jgi:hypothetical protein